MTKQLSKSEIASIVKGATTTVTTTDLSGMAPREYKKLRRTLEEHEISLRLSVNVPINQLFPVATLLAAPEALGVWELPSFRVALRKLTWADVEQAFAAVPDCPEKQLFEEKHPQNKREHRLHWLMARDPLWMPVVREPVSVHTHLNECLFVNAEKEKTFIMDGTVKLTSRTIGPCLNVTKRLRWSDFTVVVIKRREAVRACVARLQALATALTSSPPSTQHKRKRSRREEESVVTAMSVVKKKARHEPVQAAVAVAVPVTVVHRRPLTRQLSEHDIEAYTERKTLIEDMERRIRAMECIVNK